jgi:hypothetical protein
MMEPEDVYGEQEYFEVAFSFAKRCSWRLFSLRPSEAVILCHVNSPSIG